MKEMLLYLLADEEAKRFAKLSLNILAVGVTCIALLFVWSDLLFLRNAPVFKPYFGQTCLVAREEDILPAVVRLVMALSVALISSGAVLKYSAWARRISGRLLIASLTFIVGVMVSGAS